MKTRRKSSARGVLTVGVLREIHERLKKAEAETPVDYRCQVCENTTQAMLDSPAPVCYGHVFDPDKEVERHGPMEAVYVLEFPPSSSTP